MAVLLSVLFAVVLMFCQNDTCNGILKYFIPYGPYHSGGTPSVKAKTKLGILQRITRVYRSAYEKYTGQPRVVRDVSFWMRSLQIYTSYKYAQYKNKIKNKIMRRGNIDLSNQTLNEIHERNSKRMINLCLGLRGFYLKTGQFLGTRHDFMPSLYTTKLSQLHDDVPPLSGKEIRKIIEKELNGSIEDYFTSLTLDKPIGCASIAQVHDGIWKQTG